MHQRHFNLYSFAAVALTWQTTAAVSLDDFTPRVSGLPSACETLYSSDIDGCKPSDFTAGQCSSTCISALNSLTASVKSSCTKATTGDNIISAMLNGQGTLRICPNANDEDSATISSSVVSTSSKTTATASETPVIGAGTMVLSTAALSTSGLLVDTSSPTATSSSFKVSATPSTSTEVSDPSTLLTTVTKEPVAASSTSASSSVDILHDATSGATTAEATLAASSTTGSKQAQQTSSSDEGGSPFDGDTSGSSRVATSLVSLLPVVILGLFLVR